MSSDEHRSRSDSHAGMPQSADAAAQNVNLSFAPPAIPQVHCELVPLVRRSPRSSEVFLLSAPLLDALPARLRNALFSCYDDAPLSGPGAEARVRRAEALVSGLRLSPPDYASLGVVLDLPGARFGERWRAYAIDYAGVVLWPQPAPDMLATNRSLQPGHHRPPLPSYAFPHAEFRVSAQMVDGGIEEHVLLIQIRLRVLRCRGVLLRAESRWSPDTGEYISIHGLEQVAPGRYRGEVRRLLAGMPFFQRVTGSGRPTGTGTFVDREDFLTAVRAAVRALGRRRPTEENVAEYISHPKCTARQLRRWSRDFGFATWGDVLAAL